MQDSNSLYTLWSSNLTEFNRSRHRGLHPCIVSELFSCSYVQSMNKTLLFFFFVHYSVMFRLIDPVTSSRLCTIVKYIPKFPAGLIFISINSQVNKIYGNGPTESLPWMLVMTAQVAVQMEGM